MSTGKVWLVGAGPGDAGLFTRKGYEVLKAAEVVVYDSLVGAGVLSMIPEEQRPLMWASGPAITPCPRRRLIRCFSGRRKRGTGWCV